MISPDVRHFVDLTSRSAPRRRPAPSLAQSERSGQRDVFLTQSLPEFEVRSKAGNDADQEEKPVESVVYDNDCDGSSVEDLWPPSKYPDVTEHEDGNVKTEEENINTETEAADTGDATKEAGDVDVRIEEVVDGLETTRITAEEQQFEQGENISKDTAEEDTVNGLGKMDLDPSPVIEDVGYESGPQESGMTTVDESETETSKVETSGVDEQVSDGLQKQKDNSNSEAEMLGHVSKKKEDINFARSKSRVSFADDVIQTASKYENDSSRTDQPEILNKWSKKSETENTGVNQPPVGQTGSMGPVKKDSNSNNTDIHVSRVQSTSRQDAQKRNSSQQNVRQDNNVKKFNNSSNQNSAKKLVTANDNQDTRKGHGQTTHAHNTGQRKGSARSSETMAIFRVASDGVRTKRQDVLAMEFSRSDVEGSDSDSSDSDEESFADDMSVTQWEGRLLADKKACRGVRSSFLKSENNLSRLRANTGHLNAHINSDHAQVLKDVYSFVSDEQKAVFESHFSKMDANGNGVLSRDELCGQLFENATQRDLDLFLKVFDLNHDNTVDVGEFTTVAALNDKLCGNVTVDESDPLDLDLPKLAYHITAFKEMFELLDSDGDRSLSLEELMLMVTVGLSEEVGTNKGLIDHIISTVDSDNSGRIEFVEFLSFIPFFLGVYSHLLKKPALIEDIERARCAVRRALKPRQRYKPHYKEKTKDIWAE